MVLNNKKASIMNLWYMIVIFNIFIAIAFTVLIGFNNIATNEIITPIYDVSSNIAEDTTSTDIQTYIDDTYQDYQDNIIPWDIIIFALMINFYFFLIFTAIKEKAENPFMLFSLITFGSIFLLFLISISIDVQEWIVGGIYQGVFEDMTIDTPIMDYVFQNMGMISFIMALSLLVINQFDKLKQILIERLYNEE